VLRDQARKASVSIASNIAEGYERNSDREFVRYLLIAKDSLTELGLNKKPPKGFLGVIREVP
jgi:four helix bundle protein